ADQAARSPAAFDYPRTQMYRAGMLAVVALGACDVRPEASYQSERRLIAQYNDLSNDAAMSAKQSLVWPLCDDRYPRRTCGLIAENIFADDVLEYAQHTCREDGPVDKLTDECWSEFRSDFWDKLRKRY